MHEDDLRLLGGLGLTGLSRNRMSTDLINSSPTMPDGKPFHTTILDDMSRETLKHESKKSIT